VVLTIPLFPTGGLAGVLPDGKRRFAGIVAGLQHGIPDAGVAFRRLRRAGDRPARRLGGELGYPWAHRCAEGDCPLWRRAYAHVAELWKGAFPTVLVALNFLRNFGASAPSGSLTLDDLLQGDTSWFDVQGVGCYTNQLKSGAASAYLDTGTPDRPCQSRRRPEARRARGHPRRRPAVKGPGRAAARSTPTCPG
jgi:hypothetical protein